MIPGIKAVGFDLDGTFLKTHVDYAKLNDVDKVIIEKHGIPFSLVGFEANVKRPRYPLRDWLEANGRGSEYPSINKEIDDACTVVEKEFVDEATPFPGSAECIDIIKSLGLKVGILTRGSFDYARTALSNCGLFDGMDAVVGRDHSHYDNAKPSPLAMIEFAEELGVEPEEILYLGDNLTDYYSARDAGARFIGVLSGSCTREDWLAQDPDMTILDYAGDVVGILQR